MVFDFKMIEKKWQKRWEKEKIFEANPDKRKKFFLTFPYPYVNAFQHIGHFYTLMRVEVLARYKRLNGFNVLFPQAWHATGSPIINAAKRIKEREPKQLKIMKDMGISDSELKKFENPEYWIDFFIPAFKEDYKAMGISVDWRREFYTTSVNPHYDRFIKWQFRKLKEKKYCIEGKFPVVWDPKEKAVVGDHDRIEGEGVVPQEFLLVKHKLDDGRFLVSTTLRPDTILGITNLYVNPDVEYAEADIDGETWIISFFAAENLREQEHSVEIKGKVSGAELIGKTTEEADGHRVFILPATFLDANFGTGLVHSVPSESADDLIALLDLQKDKNILKKYNLDAEEIRKIKPIPVLNTPGYGEVPSQAMIDKYNVKNQNERDKLNKIKEELYKISFYNATFNERYKNFFSKDISGSKVTEKKDFVKNELIRMGHAIIYYQLTDKVVSRGLNECIVKIVENQWFLDYGNKEWKKKAHECLEDIKLYPEKARQQFKHVIDWLHEWACVRESGLGTRLPWDERWLIESLSDSTIYMAYYTVSHLLKDIPVSKLDDVFFDYIFLEGRKKPKIKGVDRMKKEFEYWYPVDFRNSGKDLIQNHLIFYLFNHTAIFPKRYWPKGIGVNGWVVVDGMKMSKSLGNMIPVKKMAEDYGADVSRLTILGGGEGMDDPNWDSNLAKSLNAKFINIHSVISENYGRGRKEMNDTDRLAESRCNTLLAEINPLMEETLFRSAIQKIFFDYWKIVRDYLSRTDNDPNKAVFRKMVDNFLIILSPFCPHISEELWEKIGKKRFVSLAKWPSADTSKIDVELEKRDMENEKTVSDIMNILKIIRDKEGKEPKRVYIYAIPSEVEKYDEKLLEKKIGKEVSVFSVNDKERYDPEGKSKKAKPGKPGIFVE